MLIIKVAIGKLKRKERKGPQEYGKCWKFGIWKNSLRCPSIIYFFTENSKNLFLSYIVPQLFTFSIKNFCHFNDVFGFK